MLTCPYIDYRDRCTCLVYMLCAFNVSTVISFDQANPMASVNVWIKRKPGYYVRVGTSHVHTYMQATVAAPIQLHIAPGAA